MIEPYIRPLYQARVGDSLARLMGRMLTPNKVTLLSVLIGLGIIPALAYSETFLALILLFLTGICDTLDGTIARLFGKTSPFGAVVDIVADRIVEFSILLGIFLISPETRALETVLMLGSVLICVTSFLVVGIFSENNSERGFHYSSGLMERPEAFLFFAGMIMFPAYFQEIAYLFTALVLLTAALRVVQFRRNLETAGKNFSS